MPFHLDLSLMIMSNDEFVLVNIHVLHHLIAPNPILTLCTASIFLAWGRSAVQISRHSFETVRNSVLHYCQPKALKETRDFTICASVLYSHPSKLVMNSVIYGPVPSWRLGRSLGVDLLSTQGKTCNFNCVYCQLGKTANPVRERRVFIQTAELTQELKSVRGVAADYVTFSGMGEPTLASNLGQAIELARDILHLPVAVLTNSSLMSREDVCDDLARADVVVAKIDAHNHDLFKQVNRPVTGLLFRDVLRGIELFRSGFKGKLCLQIMFIESNKDFAREIAKVASSLSPDEIQLNTPLRPCAVKPLTRSQMDSIQKHFNNCGNVISAYQTARPKVTPLDSNETSRRRPKL